MLVTQIPLFRFSFFKRSTNLRFADGIGGRAMDKRGLAKLVKRLDTASVAYSMEISAERPKLMTNNADGINTESVAETTWDGQRLYLRLGIKTRSSVQGCIRRRPRWQLGPVWNDGDARLGDWADALAGSLNIFWVPVGHGHWQSSWGEGFRQRRWRAVAGFSASHAGVTSQMPRCGIELQGLWGLLGIFWPRWRGGGWGGVCRGVGRACRDGPAGNNARRQRKGRVESSEDSVIE